MPTSITTIDRQRVGHNVQEIANKLSALSVEAAAAISELQGGSAEFDATDPIHLVRAATTSALAASTYTAATLTRLADGNGSINPVDGVTLAVGDRILDKDHATQTRRGIWEITALGAGDAKWSMVRADDFDESADLKSGTIISVSEGTANANKMWTLDANEGTGGLVLDTNNLTFTKLPNLADLASTSASLGASLLGVQDSAGRFAGTDAEAVLADLGARISLHFADTTAQKAVAATAVADGMLCVVDDDDAGAFADGSIWMFDTGSAAGASDYVRVPDTAVGRWLRLIPTLGDLASTDPARGSALIGYDGGTTVKAALDTILSTGVSVASKTVAFGDLTDADQQMDIAFAAALPAGACILGCGANVTAAFDNAGDTASLTFDLGTSNGAADLVDGGSLNAAAKVSTPAPAAGRPSLVGAVTPSIRFDSDVNLNTLAKGSAIFYILYSEPF